MKRGIIAAVILVLILTAGIGEQVYLRHLFGRLAEGAEAVRTAIAEDDMGSAMRRTDELQTWWESQKHALEAVVSHNETKEVTLRIAELRGYVAIGDRKSAYATVAILLETSRNLPHLLGFSWDTIC